MRTLCGGLIVLLAVALSSGCVQTDSRSSQPKPAQLMISRGTNGVNLQWNGEPGAVYTLYYRDTVGMDTEWKIMPGYNQVQGMGEMIAFEDRASTAKSRRYRVHTNTFAP